MIWWHDSFTTIKPTCKKRLRVERPRGESLRLETITQFWREHRSLEGRGFHFQFSFRVTVERVASWFWCWMFRRSYAAGILIIQQLVWYSNSLQSLEFQCKFRAIVLKRKVCLICLICLCFSMQWPVPRLRHNRSTKGNGSWTKLMVKGSAPWWRHWDSLRKRSSGPDCTFTIIDVNGDVLFLSKYPDTLSLT